MSDGTVEEADHLIGEPVWIVKEDVMTSVFQLEQLRSTGLEVAIVLDNSFSTFCIAKEISGSITEGNREIEILQHSLLGEQCFLQERHVMTEFPNYNVLPTSSLRH